MSSAETSFGLPSGAATGTDERSGRVLVLAGRDRTGGDFAGTIAGRSATAIFGELRRKLDAERLRGPT